MYGKLFPPLHLGIKFQAKETASRHLPRTQALLGFSVVGAKDHEEGKKKVESSLLPSRANHRKSKEALGYEVEQTANKPDQSLLVFPALDTGCALSRASHW